MSPILPLKQPGFGFYNERLAVNKARAMGCKLLDVKSCSVSLVLHQSIGRKELGIPCEQCISRHFATIEAAAIELEADSPRIMGVTWTCFSGGESGMASMTR